MNRTRAAFTLLEVTIASLLFIIAAAAVMESMTATRHLVSNGAARDQLEYDGDLAIRAIAADLASSGWEFADPTETTTYAAVSAATDRTLRYYPMVQVQPTPGGGNLDGFNTRLPWTRLLDANLPGGTLPAVLRGNQADALAANLPDADWNASFHARSTSLVFLKVAIGSWQPDQDPGTVNDRSIWETAGDAGYLARRPSELQPPMLNFTADATGVETAWQDWNTPGNHANLRVLFTSGFDEQPTGWVERFPGQPYGATLDGGWYDWGDVEEAPIKPAWESMRRPTPGAVADIAQRRAYMSAPERLREYMYCVVPSPTALGMGRLVRAYRVPDAAAVAAGVDPGQRITVTANDAGAFATETVGMVVDRVLSDDVVRVVFDTYRTVDAGGAQVQALGINQVRVRLFLARRQVTNPDVVLSRVIETTIAMRSRSSGGDMARVAGVLGATPIGIQR